MKSSYELAMERLNKSSPTVKLTEKQKQELAEIDSRYAAKIAERELLVQDELRKAIEKGDGEAVEQLEKQRISNRKALEIEREEKKEKLRQGGAA
jgi:LTXXQ motif family protein